MRRLAALVVLLLALAAAQAHAEMPLRDFSALAEADAGRYLDGVASALAWANAVLEAEGRPPLFCPPRGTELNARVFREVLEEAIRALAEEEAARVDVPILLLKGLRARWPCQTPNPPGGRST